MEIPKCKSKDYTPAVIYVLNSKDCVFDEKGVMIRMKRKYGKYNRGVHILVNDKIKEDGR